MAASPPLPQFSLLAALAAAVIGTAAARVGSRDI